MTTKGEWKEYTGSDEQIAELKNATYGYVLRFADMDWEESEITHFDPSQLDRLKTDSAICEYLICNPHPLADMICQWAMTGQPVWVRKPAHRFEWDSTFGNVMVDYVKTEKTTTPDWNIPNAEYSFTAFEE